MNQVDYHVGRIAKSLENSQRYSVATQSRVGKDASVLVVLFMTLGMHDEDSAIKASAPRLVELAEELVNVSSDFAKSKAAYDALVSAMNGGATGGKPLAWEPRYQLGLLMKQVTTIHSRLKRHTRREATLAKQKEEAAGQAAVLAAIGQAALVDTHEVKDESMLGDWYKYAAEMREAAGAVGQSIVKDDFASVTANMQRLQKNCDACHEEFRIDTTITATEEE
jgi:cytochrome c556